MQIHVDLTELYLKVYGLSFKKTLVGTQDGSKHSYSVDFAVNDNIYVYLAVKLWHTVMYLDYCEVGIFCPMTV